MKMVAEGVRTTEAALALGERAAIDLPITDADGRRAERPAQPA